MLAEKQEEEEDCKALCISCKRNKSVTSVYWKPAFSVIFRNFESFIENM